MNDPQPIFQVERPHANLLKLYLLRAVLSGPAIIITLPLLYFRYITLRYRIDDEGIGMRWGILFRREVNLTYGRIQDIHLTSGPLQRWLGLADLHIQTASGSAAAEMVLEGLPEFESIRDFLYSRMRGGKSPANTTAAAGAQGDGDELLAALTSVRDELRATRAALESRGGAERPHA
jgi:uncharacterized membrane protein YdbT with pleckstrin-like domain